MAAPRTLWNRTEEDCQLINIEPITLIIHMVFFLIVVFAILNPLLFKPLLRVMDERTNRVDDNLKAADEAGNKYESLRQDYEHKLEQASSDAASEREKIKKSAEEEEDRMIKEAREKAGDMVADVREKISKQYGEAREKLMADSEAAGNDIAERILGRSL